MKQFPLPLRVAHQFSRENFIVSPCNEDAFALVERFPSWQSHAAVIIGAPASGKTHLAQIWKEKTGATEMSAALPTGNIVVDDADGVDQTALFHLLNGAKEQGVHVLLTCKTPPAAWTTLPDLASRLKSLPTATLEEPDDEALAGVITTLCQAHGLQISEEAIRYILPRIERSFSAAIALAERLHTEALASKRLITVPFLSAIFNEAVSNTN